MHELEKRKQFKFVSMFYATESWILYRGQDNGVSDIIREAYRNYGDMEFGSENDDKSVGVEERHVKLISIAGNHEDVEVKYTDLGYVILCTSPVKCIFSC
jgi:hypothetical protein